jgi:hypothetical protein
MRASGIVVENEDYGFEEIQSIDSRLASLEVDGPDVLSSFYEPHLKSFSIKPGSVEVRSVVLVHSYQAASLYGFVSHVCFLCHFVRTLIYAHEISTFLPLL